MCCRCWLAPAEDYFRRERIADEGSRVLFQLEGGKLPIDLVLQDLFRPLFPGPATGLFSRQYWQRVPGLIFLSRLLSVSRAGLADPDRGPEYGADGEYSSQFMGRNGCQAHRCNASAR
jgi:hypothetical protein